MKKVLYLITELDPGGAEKALHALATRIDQRKYEPVVACLTGHGVVGAWLEKAGVEVVYLNMKSPSLLRQDHKGPRRCGDVRIRGHSSLYAQACEDSLEQARGDSQCR